MSEQAEVELPTGGAQAWALLAPAITPLLRVGLPGRYAVRLDVYRPGGPDDPTYDEAWDDEGSETVVVRFWPVSHKARQEEPDLQDPEHARNDQAHHWGAVGRNSR